MPARGQRRSRWHPLCWIGLDRRACIFLSAEFHRDEPDATCCLLKVEIPRGPPLRGGSSAERPHASLSVALALAATILLGGCGDGGDRIQDTRDPCEFVLNFAVRCMPAGTTAICTHRRTIIARSTARECGKSAE